MIFFWNLRKRWVLAAIFFTSVVYFVYNTVPKLPKTEIKDRNIMQIAEYHKKAEGLVRSLKWHMSDVGANSTDDSDLFEAAKPCRNSLQGKTLLADEQGYICKRTDVKSNGCCDKTSEDTKRYLCSSCKASNCCLIYEHCVSCCMRPSERPLLERIIKESANTLQQMVFLSMRDQFELCLSKCRTSSSSVQHENTYRDVLLKYCFGRGVPELKIT